MIFKSRQRVLFLIICCTVLLPLKGVAAPEASSLSASREKQSAPTQLKSPTTLKPPLTPRLQSQPQRRTPVPASQYGYCCANGKVVKNDALGCKREQGKFFRNRISAQKACDAQQGYCCKEGKLSKSRRGNCDRSKGRFFAGQTEAGKVCDATRGFCCSEGKAAASTKGDCNRKKGSFFMTQQLAAQQCAKAKGYCCKDGKATRSTQGVCSKQRGEFFINKKQAKQNCDRQQGYCCDDAKIFPTSQGVCKKKKGKFYLHKQMAERSCKDEQGNCLVNGRLVPNKSKDECSRLAGTYRITPQNQLSRQMSQQLKGFCCVDGKLQSKKTEAECKRLRGSFFIRRDVAAANCRLSTPVGKNQKIASATTDSGGKGKKGGGKSLTAANKTKLKAQAAVQGKNPRVQQFGKTTLDRQSSATKKLALQKSGAVGGAPKSAAVRNKALQKPGEKALVTKQAEPKAVVPGLLNPQLVRLQKLTGKSIDPESYLARKLQSHPLLGHGAASEFSKRTIEAGKDATKSLGDIAKSVFKNQDELRQNLAKIKPESGVILKPPTAKSETYEFKDSFVLIKSTGVTVTNPEKLARISTEFARFMGEEKKRRVEYSSLSREEKEGLQDLIDNDLPKLPDDDPIKAASKKGAQAVLDAISEGKGLFEVTEEIVVPKKQLPFIDGIPQLPKEENGIFQYDQFIPPSDDFLRIMNPTARRKISDVISDKVPIKTDMPIEHSVSVLAADQSKANFDAKFMTGFTFSHVYDFTKTWKFTGGLFRLKTGAGYTVGLRLPLQVTGEVSPARITVFGQRDMETSFETSLTATTVNGNCDFFKETGLRGGFGGTCGKELAIDFFIYYGIKFRFCKTDVIDMSRPVLQTGATQDFTPPFGNNAGSVTFWIPAIVTGTEVGIRGIVNGAVQVGFKISGNGTIYFDLESFYGDTSETSKLTFASSGPVSTSTTMSPMTVSSTEGNVQQPYGFRLYNPEYVWAPSFTPGVKFSLDVGYDGFDRTFAYRMWLEAAETYFAPVTFGLHSGTTAQYRWEGEKLLRRE